jgi:hypothetical protein
MPMYNLKQNFNENERYYADTSADNFFKEKKVTLKINEYIENLSDKAVDKIVKLNNKKCSFDSEVDNLIILNQNSQINSNYLSPQNNLIILDSIPSEKIVRNEASPGRENNIKAYPINTSKGVKEYIKSSILKADDLIVNHPSSNKKIINGTCNRLSNYNNKIKESKEKIDKLITSISPIHTVKTQKIVFNKGEIQKNKTNNIIANNYGKNIAMIRASALNTDSNLIYNDLEISPINKNSKINLDDAKLINKNIIENYSDKIYEKRKINGNLTKQLKNNTSE